MGDETLKFWGRNWLPSRSLTARRCKMMVGRLLSYWVIFQGRAVKLREGNCAYFGLSSVQIIVITNSIVNCFVANDTFFLQLLPITVKGDTPTCFGRHPSPSTEILGFNGEPSLSTYMHLYYLEISI